MTAEPLIRKAGLLDDESGLHLLTLSVLLTSTLGPEFLTWEFETLRRECEERWGNIGAETWQRIQALTVLHAHEGFWTEWEIFENITAAIVGEFPLFSFTQPPEAEECAIAIVTAAKVDRHDYADEVKNYIIAACLNDGLWYFDGTPMEMCKQLLQEFDASHGVQRDYAAVVAALKAKDGFYEPAETAAQVQANRAREVQLVLSRYNAAVNEQLRGLKVKR